MQNSLRSAHDKPKRSWPAVRKRWDEVFHRPYNVVVYLAIAGAISLDAIWGSSLAIVATLVIVLAWDILYCIRPRNFGQNEPRFILKRVIETQTLAQYFVTFYGVVLAALLASGSRVSVDHVSKPELFAPLLFGSLALILIPVRIAEHRRDRAEVCQTSPSMRGMLLVVMFSQQAAAITFVHAITKFVRHAQLSQPAQLAPSPPSSGLRSTTTSSRPGSTAPPFPSPLRPSGSVGHQRAADGGGLAESAAGGRGG
jgi:hypothetical protein